jgi:type II secretory pathway component PulF
MGKIALNLELSTVFMNLAMLNGGGIPLLDSLRHATAAVSSALIRDRMTKALEIAMHGGKLSEAFADPIFPPMVGRAITHAEATGRFDIQFGGVAKFLRNRTAAQLQLVATFIEPALILVGGGMLLLMALAVFLPVYGQLRQIVH